MKGVAAAVVGLLVWGCIALVAYFGVAKQIQTNRREGRRLNLPPWGWALISVLIVAAAAVGWFLIGPAL